MDADFYKRLGLTKDASQEDIEKAYKKAARKYHPDLNKGETAAEDFKKVTEAYDVLKNPESRQRYDMSGSNSGFFNNFFDFSNAFATHANRKSNKNLDLQVTIYLDFGKIIDGSKEKIDFSYKEKCKKCEGKGGTEFKKCAVCDGAGASRYTQGPFSFLSHCADCSGKGQVLVTKCDVCSGSGFGKDVKDSIEINIPSGAHDGQIMKFSGRGHKSSTGDGDLYVVVRVKPHKHYQREGYSLHTIVAVTYSQLILGDEMDLVLPNNKKVQFKLPPRTKVDKIFRLRGLGIKQLWEQYGDLFVHLDLTMPKNITDDYLQLINSLRKIEKNEVAETAETTGESQES